MLRRPQAWLLFPATIVCFAQSVPSQLSLAGFQPGQFLRTAEAAYPAVRVERTAEDHWLTKGFTISVMPEVTIILQALPGEPRRIHSIQVIGDPASRHPLMLGMRLGMTEKEVVGILGPSKERKAYKDGDVDYVRLDWESRNYSCEFDGKGRLISFMLYGFQGFPDKPEMMPDTSELKAAIRETNLSVLEEILAPDFEIYLNGEVIKYEKAATTDLEENSRLRKAVLGPGGLKEALSLKDAEEDFQLRVAEAGEGSMHMYSVCKFPKSKLLKEIVYTYFAGRWRIYEIAFREGGNKTQVK